jgi:hypothetical protein
MQHTRHNQLVQGGLNTQVNQPQKLPLLLLLLGKLGCVCHCCWGCAGLRGS